MIRSSRSRVLLGVLAFALWVATSLGGVHRSVHGHLPAQTAAVHVERSAEAGPAPQGLLALFGEHTDADCRLYDQLSHGPAALGVPLVVLPIVLPAATFAWFEGEALARWVALFDARGPPSTR